MACQFVGDTNDGSLGNGVMLNEGGFDLRGRQTVTADIDNVVDTAADPVETLVVTASTVTSKLQRTKFSMSLFLEWGATTLAMRQKERVETHT